MKVQLLHTTQKKYHKSQKKCFTSSWDQCDQDNENIDKEHRV